MKPPTTIIRAQMRESERRASRARKKGHAAATIAIWRCACRELRAAQAQRDALVSSLADAWAVEDTALEAGGYWPQEVHHA